MPQSIADIESELAEVRQAIRDCYKAGQSYSKPGMSFNRVLFNDLSKREKALELKLQRSQNGGAAFLSDFSREEDRV